MLSFASRFAAALAVACLFVALPAQAEQASRPVTVDDIVALEAFGRAEISPDGRWAVYEKRGPYNTIPRFEFAWRSTWTIMDLWLVDLADPTAPPRLLLPGEGPGLQKVSWSPGGERLLITRLRGRDFEYGVVAMAERTVVWTGLTPEVPTVGATTAWISDDELVLMVRADGSLPATLRYDGGAQLRTSAAWEMTAQGVEPSRTIVDARSGVEGSEQPRPSRSLVRMNLNTGKQEVLADGMITDLALSPDRRRLAIVQGEEGVPISLDKVIQTESPYRERLRLVDLHQGNVSRPIDEYDVAPHLLRWSPDSAAVLVWARQDGLSWSQGKLIQAGSDGVVFPDVGELTPGSDVDVQWGVRADWVGMSPVIFARTPDGRMDWHLLSPARPPQSLTASLSAAPLRISNTGKNALYLFADGGYWSMSGKGLRRLTPPDLTLSETVPRDQEQIRRLGFNEAPRRDWTLASGPQGDSYVLTIDGEARALNSPTGESIRILASSPKAALSVDRVGMAETLRLRSPRAANVVDAVNTSLANVALTEPVAISHLDLHGRPTRSWLFLPKGAAAGQIRGLIVKVYPGNTDSLVWADPLVMTYGIRTQVLVAAGFAVLSPSIPGKEPAVGRGDVYARSVDIAVDAALAAFPDLPEDRMAIFGHSFGGYAALEIAARTTRYKSYIASASFSDMSAIWGEFNPANRIQPEDGMMTRSNQGWAETGQGGLEAPPWKASEAYRASSPYLIAHRIRSPVLLLTADLDFVPMTQAERIFSVLHRTGGRTRLITYWGENHHLWSPANIRDRYEQIFSWLDATLGVKEEISASALPAPPRS
ncbi:S9 family peptidase [Brevundimonas diminuta]|uniref:S9 family peptidase n=1 Tax=Brevundimonas diminuta TaxID=293 RepID=A0A410NYP7_BREDI|nr:prolyl oligopeptidase family serine peptidase [Brevundimonas diminuta]MBD3572498.1 S9 family peptidase [Brevundimonas diminuta]MBD3817825.1 S9 family peptidase [Brevundimonas diminuta]QAT15012.1 S9 family peptidase [Brevundimonas diminuta]QQB87607.1 S9 family peptidase [Brevundimonas diminuta]GEC01475.1 S9 family peptidase [Brevundimonas diminuta]